MNNGPPASTYRRPAQPSSTNNNGTKQAGPANASPYGHVLNGAGGNIHNANPTIPSSNPYVYGNAPIGGNTQQRSMQQQQIQNPMQNPMQNGMAPRSMAPNSYPGMPNQTTPQTPLSRQPSQQQHVQYNPQQQGGYPGGYNVYQNVQTGTMPPFRNMNPPTGDSYPPPQQQVPQQQVPQQQVPQQQVPQQQVPQQQVPQQPIMQVKTISPSAAITQSVSQTIIEEDKLQQHTLLNEATKQLNTAAQAIQQVMKSAISFVSLRANRFPEDGSCVEWPLQDELPPPSWLEVKNHSLFIKNSGVYSISVSVVGHVSNDLLLRVKRSSELPLIYAYSLNDTFVTGNTTWPLSENDELMVNINTSQISCLEMVIVKLV